LEPFFVLNNKINKKVENMKWKRNDKVIEESIVDYLANLFDEELAKNKILKVSIGTDSQKISKTLYRFATVILITATEDLGGGVIWGRGGMIISATYNHDFKKKDLDGKKRDKELVNERMVFEVGKSIEVATEIAELLDLYEIKMEIHADINPDPKHDSNKALQSAVGYILGMGYDFKIKPDAWAASTAADRKC
jgi:predicted RNase H-related nuclease YkuK (DUF458 family)